MQEVKKRSLFYLSGYDPRGVRHYYNLYKKEAKKQERVDGVKIDISKRTLYRNNIYHWRVTYTDSQTITTTDYYFLSWDDYIREKWYRGSFDYTRSLWKYTKLYIFRGLFLGYIKKTKATTITIFIPFLFLISSFFISFITTIFINSILVHFIDGYLSIFISTVFGVTIFLSLMKISEKLPISWLNRVFTFSAFLSHGFGNKLKGRIHDFTGDIVEILQKERPDEFLIVSHSVGTILTIPLIDDLIKNNEEALFENHKISVVTLGECIPLVSGVPEAYEFRNMLKNISLYKNIRWMDYTSKIDGACFPGLNFFEDSDINLKYENNYEFTSPRFHTLYDKNHYKSIKKNKYLSHFLYLMSTESKTGYNYFRMTAGPNKLKI